jgi:hypothetical protein
MRPVQISTSTSVDDRPEQSRGAVPAVEREAQTCSAEKLGILDSSELACSLVL